MEFQPVIIVTNGSGGGRGIGEEKMTNLYLIGVNLEPLPNRAGRRARPRAPCYTPALTADQHGTVKALKKPINAIEQVNFKMLE